MIPRAVENMARRNGRTFTVRRETVAAGANAWTKGAATVSYVEVRARQRFFRPDEIRGGIAEGDALVVMPAPPCGFAPAKGDRIAPGSHCEDAGAPWLQVVNVYAPEIGDKIPVYRLTVRR